IPRSEKRFAFSRSRASTEMSLAGTVFSRFSTEAEPRLPVAPATRFLVMSASFFLMDWGIRGSPSTRDSRLEFNDDLADRLATLEQFVGGLHVFGVEAVQQAVGDRSNLGVGGELRDGAQDLGLALDPVAIQALGEDDLRVDGDRLEEERAQIGDTSDIRG